MDQIGPEGHRQLNTQATQSEVKRANVRLEELAKDFAWLAGFVAHIGVSHGGQGKSIDEAIALMRKWGGNSQ